LASILLASEGNFTSLEAKSEYRREECKELSEVLPEEYDLAMKSHRKEILKSIEEEMTLDNYGHVFCEYDGVIEASSVRGMDLKELNLDCIMIDYVNSEGVPLEWAATLDAEISYSNGKSGLFDIELYCEDGEFYSEISDKY
jgi:hypothetical protein